jgi:hypothetical protein
MLQKTTVWHFTAFHLLVMYIYCVQEGDWTMDELSHLAKAVAKFPAGTEQRWHKIADMMGRSVQEVTAKSKQLKAGYAITVDPAAQGMQ